MSRTRVTLGSCVSIVFMVSLAVIGCSSGDGGNSNNPGADTGTNPSVDGKACKSDGECGAGYHCEGTGSGPCTPDRLCNELECKGICLTTPGGFDPVDGTPTKECMDKCLAEAKCCSGPGPATDGKCRKDSGPTPSDAGPTPSDTSPATMDWNGTWSITLSYTTDCDVGFGSIKSGKNSHTLTMPIKSSGSSLEATPQVPDSGWSSMSGTGDGSGATISGEFPFRDHAGEIVSSKDNSTTLKIDKIVSSKEAGGSFEGRGQNRFGFKCTTKDGVITLKR